MLHPLGWKYTRVRDEKTEFKLRLIVKFEVKRRSKLIQKTVFR